MTEEFLQYIWQNHLFSEIVYTLSNGEKLEILSPGKRNNDSGPDFIDVRIKKDGYIWVGNCELHLQSSDWYKHQHHLNPDYDNVILHVVYKHDQDIINSKGNIIPTVEINFDPVLVENYQSFIVSKSKIACERYIQNVEPVYIASMLDRTVVERLMNKTQDIHNILKASNYDWEACSIICMAKAFGFKVNAGPFEMLARSIPLNILLKLHEQLFSLEALLFGQAGLLDQTFNDEYPIKLQQEYRHFQNMYNLKPIEGHLWRKMRIRPANFPAIRISQFAQFIHKYPQIFSILLEIENLNQAFKLFEISASEYWNTHFQFDKESKFQVKNFSRTSILLIVINTIVPLLFSYGIEKNIDIYKDKALALLEEADAEENHIVSFWKDCHLLPHNASDTQALIQLYNYYCQPRKCTKCDIFNQIMLKKLHEN
jgi:hypothetical protein